MNELNFSLSALSPLFQEQFAAFTAARAEYLQTQESYQVTVKETARLMQTAQALEAEAEQVNVSWKAMAMARHADQRKINQEVERSVQLKMEAEKYRRTASVREELHGGIVVQMAKARGNVSDLCTSLRSRYRDERIAALLNTEGLRELLRELLDLAGDDFGSLLAKTANQAEGNTSTVLAEIFMPRPIAGEFLPKNRMELHRLEMSGGKSTSHAIAH